jgi:hypothetical protein
MQPTAALQTTEFRPMRPLLSRHQEDLKRET